MKVKELIVLLQKQNQEATVLLDTNRADGGSYYGVDTIIVEPPLSFESAFKIQPVVIEANTDLSCNSLDLDYSNPINEDRGESIK